MDKTQEVTFHTFLKAMRKGKKVTLDRLSRGICSASMLARIEAGERLPEKIVRDRFLERLGLTNDGYEDYLQPDEYEVWESWKALLRAVENKDYKEADSLIEQYEQDNHHHSNVIERQFYLAMKGQLAQYRNVPEAELCMLYEHCGLPCRKVRMTSGGNSHFPCRNGICFWSISILAGTSEK